MLRHLSVLPAFTLRSTSRFLSQPLRLQLLFVVDSETCDSELTCSSVMLHLLDQNSNTLIL